MFRQEQKPASAKKVIVIQSFEGEPQNRERRYSRQELFRPIGPSGQERLKDSRVAIVGMGALGTVAATQLVRAGVGFLRLIDRDIVEESNLQRQSLYDEQDALEFQPKAAAAASKLRLANSLVEIESVITDVTWKNAESYLTDVDAILDATDNFQIRYLINDVAVKHGIPWAYGGAVSSYGTTAFFRPGVTPCLVCLFGPDSGGGHDTCDTVGVIAPIVSTIASLQVANVMKYVTGNVDALPQGLTYVDVWTNEFRSVQFPQASPTCPCCGKREFRSLAASSESLTVSLCGRRTVQVRPSAAGSNTHINLEPLAARLRSVGVVRHNPNLLRLETPDFQLTLFQDGRALIHGVDEPSEARTIYARYVGM